MEKYAKYSGNRSELFQAVEVPLTMQPDNANKFAALDKLNQLQRPDPEATRVVFEDDGETVKMEAVEMIDSGEQDEEGNPILQPILDKEGTPIMVPVVEECGLQKLQAVLEEIERLHKHGAPASSLRAAMGQQHRQGNVGEIFDAVDTDESGYVDVDEFTAAGRALADSVGFTISETELRDEFDSIDVDGGGMIEKLEFTEWWTEFTVDRKEAKLEKQAALEAVGLRDEMPSTKELKKLLTMLWNLTPTIGMNAAAFEALEDLCPDDETFDLLQDCYNLCDLKRTMITDSNARDAIIGLEAMCVVPKLLEGDERLHIPANPEAMAVLKKVEEGNEAALLALQNLRQREVRRMWAMLTGRQRRFVLVAGAVAGYPLLMLATGGAITMEMFTGMFDELPECNYTNASYAENGPVNVSCVDAVRETGSWQEGDSNLENMDTPADSNSTGVGEDNFTNPSFYVLGFTPMVLSLFVTLFGQRIASIITMIMVFISSASVGIGSALNDGSDEFTPAKLVGVAGGCYAGGMALKVASSNIKFAYGVQGAAIGATVCRMTTQLWQPKLLLLVPEVEPHLGWVDISMAAVCAAGAAKIANKFRGVISIVSTAAIGTLGSIQMMSAYGIPHMDRFTIDSLMSGRAMCGSEESGCWGALATGLTLVYAGTLNQFKMAAMDFSLPAVTIYEKLLAKVDKSMTLLFALNEYLSGEVSMDMDDLMQRALNARDAMAKYMSLFANLGMFSLTLGFFADFFVNLTNGVFAAAPWVGMCSLAMAIVTPIQATIGVLSDTFTAKRFLNRVQEFRVPKFLKKIPLLNKFKAFAQGSFIVNFDKVGAFLQELSFRFGMLNMFIAMAIAGMSYVTATMYAIQVRANWDEMSLEMPDYTMDQAIAKVEATVNGLGDSAMGLITILGASISATAFNLGGMSWLLTNLVNMEKFFVLGAGAIIGGMSFKMGSDWPAGSYMFAPLGLTGIVTLLLGGVQAIPWFSKKFPDFMFILHKIQIIIGVGLVAMFVVMMQTARKTHEFISDNWDGCKFPDVCDLVGKGNWSFAQYAQEQNMNKDDLEGFVQPMMYAGSLSCLATMGMLVGGSNLSKFLYYKNVMSRKEELAAEQGGEDKAAVRQAALMKKVRKTRQGDSK
jgi:Ca2+-binding EF-hand superfamily protein